MLLIVPPCVAGYQVPDRIPFSPCKSIRIEEGMLFHRLDDFHRLLVEFIEFSLDLTEGFHLILMIELLV